MDFLLAGVGLVILLVAGDLLVRGAVAISLRLGVPALIVSLTIVAFGTSAPELLISVDSALIGAPGLAIGNVVGSNIANVLLVLGMPALLAGLDTREHDVRGSYTQMIVASLVFIALAFFAPLQYWHGAILLGLLIFMMLRALRQAKKARKGRDQDDDLDLEGAGTPVWRSVLYLIAGLIGLPLGADMFVTSARSIAEAAGVSDEVIGLTLVALGTSLPELATTVMAAIRRQADVAIGNVIGSNFLNITAILGITSFVAPLPIVPEFLTFDLWVMLAASLSLSVFVFGGIRIGRRAGTAYLVGYAAYMWSLF